MTFSKIFWKSVAHVGRAGVDVAVLQELHLVALVWVYVVVDNFHRHLAAGEEVDEVVDGFFQFASPSRRVVRHHGPTALKVDGERQFLHAVLQHVPSFGRSQPVADALHQVVERAVVQFALVVEQVGVTVGAGLDERRYRVEGRLRGVAADERLLDGAFHGPAASAAREGDCGEAQHCGDQQS